MSIKDKYFVQPVTKAEYAGWILKKHYAHRIPSVMYAYGLYKNKTLIGVCIFGLPASNNITNLVQGYKIIELNRLVINEIKPKNTTSWFVSHCLRLLPRPLTVISYADKGQNHHGYIYQATNWTYTGLGSSDWEFELAGKTYHRRHVYEKLAIPSRGQAIKEGYIAKPTSQKHRYFYFLGSKKQIKDMKSKLKFNILPYPKGDNKRYDASYEPEVQNLLF